MRPGRQDLNNINVTFRSCRQLDGWLALCRPLGGRQTPIFENFPIRHIFLKFCFFKYKNEKRAVWCLVDQNIYSGLVWFGFSLRLVRFGPIQSQTYSIRRCGLRGSCAAGAAASPPPGLRLPSLQPKGSCAAWVSLQFGSAGVSDVHAAQILFGW